MQDLNQKTSLQDIISYTVMILVTLAVAGVMNYASYRFFYDMTPTTGGTRSIVQGVPDSVQKTAEGYSEVRFADGRIIVLTNQIPVPITGKQVELTYYTWVYSDRQPVWHENVLQSAKVDGQMVEAKMPMRIP